MKIVTGILYEENRTVQLLIEKKYSLENLKLLLEEKQQMNEMYDKCFNELTEITNFTTSGGRLLLKIRAVAL